MKCYKNVKVTLLRYKTKSEELKNESGKAIKTEVGHSSAYDD